MLKMYLIRHGETDWNVQERIQGLSDIELNANGVMQAHQLAAHLETEGNFSRIYASPLQRSYETAQIIAARLGLPVVRDSRLVERSLGQLEGLTMGEIEAQFPDVYRAWHEGGVRPHILGEESREDFDRRAREFVEDTRAEHPGGKIIVVTHGGTLAMIVAAALKLQVEHGLPFHIDNSSISIVQWGERGARLRLLNDTCHLREAKQDATSGARVGSAVAGVRAE